VRRLLGLLPPISGRLISYQMAHSSGVFSPTIRSLPAAPPANPKAADYALVAYSHLR
jgi:hypothetical protein